MQKRNCTSVLFNETSEVWKVFFFWGKNKQLFFKTIYNIPSSFTVEF
jgi:hypothetical protein